MADPVIAIGGENLIDRVTEGGITESHPGGSPFNVAVAAARQGGMVRYVSPISTDEWGVLLVARLQEAGVTLTGGRNDLPTTMALVTITDGIPAYLFKRGSTAERAVTAQSLAQSIGTDVATLHTGSLTLIDGADAGAWEQTLAAAHKRGVLVSLDPNVRLTIISDLDSYRARIFRILAHVHLLKLSDEDLTGLFPDLSQDAAMAQLLSLTTAHLTVLTRGSDGASAWINGTRIDAPASKVDPLEDTVGAGDTFMASLLVGLGTMGYLSPAGLSQLSPSDVARLLHRATQAAALNCAKAGCNPPTFFELESALSP
jgi:fructokinase